MALVVTIIILIIVAGVSLVILMGDEGIIEKSKAAKFKSNIEEVDNKVMLYWTSKEAEAILLGTNPTVYDKLPIYVETENESTLDTEEFSESLKSEILEKTKKSSVDLVHLYEIDKTLIQVESTHTYILDIDRLDVYDYEGEKFQGKMHHSLEGSSIIDESEENTDTPIPEQTENLITYDENGEVGWLKPDVSGFNRHYTFLAYYNKNNLDDIKYITTDAYVYEYNKVSEINENGKTYILDAYDDNMWANIKSTANELTTWWVWIPRYAYKITEGGEEIDPSIDVVFIDMNNTPIGSKYYGKYTVNNDGTITINGETYIVHSCFAKKDASENTIQLKGIWMAKYEATSTVNRDHRPDSGECYAPDMTGFDPNSTYIELFDVSTGEFTSEIKLANADLQTINQNDEWYDYKNKIWANIKTIANGTECWWVWIPRYAYSMVEAEQETDIIFVDTRNRPYDKEEYGGVIPPSMTVHPCFSVRGKTGKVRELKGIWMAKYEATGTNNANLYATSGDCIAPNMIGFDPNNTYIELYDKTTGNFISEVKLANADLSSINDNKQWYDYKNKIWANVKTYANGAECWWVWIPRYAYNICNTEWETDVVFIGLDNRPIDKTAYGNELDWNEMEVHLCFIKKDENGNTVQLGGIWMAKYEAMGIPTE